MSGALSTVQRVFWEGDWDATIFATSDFQMPTFPAIALTDCPVACIVRIFSRSMMMRLPQLFPRIIAIELPTARKILMTLRKLISRLTGFSTRLGGLSRATPEPAADILRRTVTFLENRRVLWKPHVHEQPHHCESILKIRIFLADELDHIDTAHPLFEPFEEMRAVCEAFLSSRPMVHVGNDRSHSQFEKRLLQFRVRFMSILHRSASQFKVPLPDRLVLRMNIDWQKIG